MKIRFFFAWYDLWMGFYWDSKRATLYICPLPCCVIALELFPVCCPKCGGQMVEHDTCYDECLKCDFWAIYYDGNPDRVWTRFEIWRAYRHGITENNPGFSTRDQACSTARRLYALQPRTKTPRRAACCTPGSSDKTARRKWRPTTAVTTLYVVRVNSGPKLWATHQAGFVLFG